VQNTGLVYDVVVLGAGSAGSVVAARASEDPNKQICLIESGPDYTDSTSLPDDLANPYKNSLVDHDWNHSYQPTAEHENINFPRGRVTGGSSAVNTTIALRGIPEDYDHWGDLGNSEWTWSNVLPSFIRLERDLDFGAEKYHGDAGPIAIRRHPWSELTMTHQAWWETARNLGIPDCEDHNRPDSFGAGAQPMNRIGSLRISTALAYLGPARRRPNLTIQADSHVRRLIIKNHKVTSVEIQTVDGAIENIHAKLFVLSAGAIQTPGVLRRSGIGKPDDIQAMGLDLVAQVNGVGHNLQDHPIIALTCELIDPTLARPDMPLIQTIMRYTANGSTHRNDLQIELTSWTQRDDIPSSFGLLGVLEHTYGSGSVLTEQPVINSLFCEDDRDASRLTQSLQDCLQFSRTKPLSDLISKVSCNSQEVSKLDTEELTRLVRRYAKSGYHPCGTAKMGLATDPESVVDQYGRSHSIDGLVIADASIMPQIPRANTNLTSIMIGERIGEWIRTDSAGYGI
jgi:choline dehydrogenase